MFILLNQQRRPHPSRLPWHSVRIRYLIVKVSSCVGLPTESQLCPSVRWILAIQSIWGGTHDYLGRSKRKRKSGRDMQIDSWEKLELVIELFKPSLPIHIGIDLNHSEVSGPLPLPLPYEPRTGNSSTFANKFGSTVPVVLRSNVFDDSLLLFLQVMPVSSANNHVLVTWPVSA